MSFANADRVRETSTTTGTGTYSLAGAVAGFRTFVAGVGTGNVCHYVAEDGADWEVGLGTVTDATPDTLARTRIFASSNGGSAVNWGAGTRQLYCAPTTGAEFLAKPHRGHIFDLTTSNDAGDTTNDIAVAAGEATDESGEVRMVLAASITKRIDAAWAVGTGGGGMNTGAVADNTWYEVVLIYRQDTGVVDVMFSTTANRSTLPASYTHKRRIGWVRRGSAANLQFTQVGDEFTLTTQVNDVAASKTTSATAVTLTVPPNTIAKFRAGADMSTSVNANSSIVFSEIAEGNVTPALATGIISLGYWDLATGSSGGHFWLRVNGSSQIEHDADVAVGAFDISTYGWIDDRRRLS